MSTKKSREIADYLVGTCKSSGDAEFAFNVDSDYVLAAVIEEEIDTCSECGWWFDKCDLEVIDDELVCGDCDDRDHE